MDKFDEDKHPRDDGGKFSHKDGATIHVKDKDGYFQGDKRQSGKGEAAFVFQAKKDPDGNHQYQVSHGNETRTVNHEDTMPYGHREEGMHHFDDFVEDRETGEVGKVTAIKPGKDGDHQYQLKRYDKNSGWTPTGKEHSHGDLNPLTREEAMAALTQQSAKADKKTSHPVKAAMANKAIPVNSDDPAVLAARAAVLGAVAGSVDKDSIYDGGAKTFYTPEEWSKKEGTNLKGAVLVFAYENNDFTTMMNSKKGWSALKDSLGKEGLTFEPINHWSTAIYPISQSKEPKGKSLGNQETKAMEMQNPTQSQNPQQGYGEQPIPPGLAFSQAAKELMEAALGMQENPEVQSFIKDSYAKLEAMCARAYPDAELQWQDIGEPSAPEEPEDKPEEEPGDEPAPEEDESTPDEDDDFDNDESMDFLDGDKDDEGSASDVIDSEEDSPVGDSSDGDDEEDDDPDSKDQSKPAKSSKPSKTDEDQEDDEEDEEDDEDDALMKSLARRMAETQASIAITNKKISMMTGRVD